MRVFLGFVAAACIGILVIATSSVYIVDEGNSAVVLHWGKAVGQEGPNGVQFKVPLRTTILEFDVRERSTPIKLAAATSKKLPIDVEMSANWRVDATRVEEIYKDYGTPEDFFHNIVQRRLIQAAKAGLSQFDSSELIADRTEAVAEALRNARAALNNYPIEITAIQFENIVLPPRIIEAIMLKQEAQEARDREQLNLEKQKFEAQQAVQTAEASRDSTKAEADGNAYKTRQLADAEAYQILAEAKAKADATLRLKTAEAEGLQKVRAALNADPQMVSYVQWMRWNGQLPQQITSFGTDQNVGVLLGTK